MHNSNSIWTKLYLVALEAENEDRMGELRYPMMALQEGKENNTREAQYRRF
jgi:hypothetical protein